jgi:hypothetical protein
MCTIVFFFWTLIIVQIIKLQRFETWLQEEEEPGSSGSIVSGYGLDDRAIEVRLPAEAKGF